MSDLRTLGVIILLIWVCNNCPVEISEEFSILRSVYTPLLDNAASIDIDTVPELSIKSYVDTYKELAIAEGKLYNIPWKIILGQAIIESDIGRSYLAKQANNHFGMKCFSKTCAKGHCINRQDDTHKDFFLCFAKVKDSYRQHSILLMKKRYRKLRGVKDYTEYAKGLQECGYATDRFYASKLTKICLLL